MKKSFLALAVVLGATTTFAQDLTSKKGEAYLPEAGDWAVGIDAMPIVNYFGNFIGGNGSNYGTPSWDFNNSFQTITGKYFVDATTAYRAHVRLGFGSDKGSEMVADRSFTGTIEYPSSQAPEVENTFKMGSTNIGLGGGIEMRRGAGRLQGFYGGELGIMLASEKATYTYGNALNQNTTGNVDVDADDDMGSLTTDPFGNTARITEWKSGSMFGLGLRGFIGAEYFVLPKLSVGGEFGWGLGFMSGGTSSTTMESEGLNGSGNEVRGEFTEEVANGSSFGIDTDNNNTVFGGSGNLRITFHF